MIKDITEKILGWMCYIGLATAPSMLLTMVVCGIFNMEFNWYIFVMFAILCLSIVIHILEDED